MCFRLRISIALCDLHDTEERHDGHLRRQKYQHDFKDLRSDSCDRHVSLTAFEGGGARHVVLSVGQSSRSSDTPPSLPKKKKTRQEPQEGQHSDAGSAP